MFAGFGSANFWPIGAVVFGASLAIAAFSVAGFSGAGFTGAGVAGFAGATTAADGAGGEDGLATGPPSSAVMATVVGAMRLPGLPAAHESLQQDAQGRHLFLGFLVRVGPFTLYHSGDTVDYPGLAGRLAQARVDLAFLPINGRAPERRVTGNLDGPEAADLAHRAGIALVVPCHYELFSFSTASTEPFLTACKYLGVQPHVLHAGERLTLPVEN